MLLIINTVNTSGCRGDVDIHGGSGSAEDRYNAYKEMYTGCTYVQNSLVIVDLDLRQSDHSFDLRFLENIREVQDYVFIRGNGFNKSLPLLGLQLIRGVKLYDGGYSLYVQFNILEELQLKSLQGRMTLIQGYRTPT